MSLNFNSSYLNSHFGTIVYSNHSVFIPTLTQAEQMRLRPEGIYEKSPSGVFTLKKIENADEQQYASASSESLSKLALEISESKDKSENSYNLLDMASTAYSALSGLLSTEHPAMRLLAAYSPSKFEELEPEPARHLKTIEVDPDGVGFLPVQAEPGFPL